jgi:hypothetical protein
LSQNKIKKDWGCSSVVDCLPSICEALGSISSTGGGVRGKEEKEIKTWNGLYIGLISFRECAWDNATISGPP